MHCVSDIKHKGLSRCDGPCFFILVSLDGHIQCQKMIIFAKITEYEHRNILYCF